MVETVWATSRRADVAVYLDDDDPSDYLPDGKVVVHKAKRMGPGQSFNWICGHHPGYVAYVAATDDCRFITPEWDNWLIRQVKDRELLMIAPWNDNKEAQQHIGRTRMDFPCASQKWVETLGFFVPPLFYRHYWDVVLEHLAEKTGLLLRAERKNFEIQHNWLPSELNPINEDAKIAINYIAYHHHTWEKWLRAAQ